MRGETFIFSYLLRQIYARRLSAYGGNEENLIFPFKNYIEHYINVSEIKDISLVKYVDNKLNEKELENYITELVSEIPRLEKALKKLKVSNKGTKQAVDLILKQIH